MVAGILAALVLAGAAAAQEISSEVIRRVPVPGSEVMEVVVSLLTVPPGARIPLHTHPGDEHAVVITPARAAAPNGQVVEFTVGQSLYFPEGQVHGGLTIVGDTDMQAVTTHVVRVGEPFLTPAE
jgi:quercetin dioxygenase-like cupin family protein